MKASREFPGEPASIRTARNWVAEALGPVPAETAQMIVLMVSELTTNSVRHAGSAFRVDIDQQADHIHVEISDSGAGEPVVQSPSQDRPSGRGLLIVDNLAHEWGVRSLAVGKAVWFVVRTPPKSSQREPAAQQTSGLAWRAGMTGSGSQGSRARCLAA